MVKRLAVLVIALAACGLGAYLGAWWVPFPVGLAAGLPGVTGWLGRGGVLAATAGAVLGWALPLWAMALSHLPVGATGRAIAALAGLPPYAGVAVTVTLLLAALQVLAGAWLARAILPGSSASPAGGSAGPKASGVPDLGDPQT